MLWVISSPAHRYATRRETQVQMRLVTLTMCSHCDMPTYARYLPYSSELYHLRDRLLNYVYNHYVLFETLAAAEPFRVIERNAPQEFSLESLVLYKDCHIPVQWCHRDPESCSLWSSARRKEVEVNITDKVS